MRIVALGFLFNFVTVQILCEIFYEVKLSDISVGEHLEFHFLDR